MKRLWYGLIPECLTNPVEWLCLAGFQVHPEVGAILELGSRCRLCERVGSWEAQRMLRYRKPELTYSPP